MIRPLTCLCLAAAFGSGLYLYSEKHRAEMLDRRIGAVVLATGQAKARTEQLKTEWAMLNEPGRLEAIAAKYLQNLKPMAPGQFVQLADLPNRLPPPEAPKLTGNTDEDAPVPVAGDPAPSEMASDPAPDAPAPSLIKAPPPIELKPASHPAPKLLAKADTKPRHVAVADHESVSPGGALAHGTMLPLAAPQPMGARVMSAMAHPMHTPRARVAVASATPAYAAPAYIGSAIATGRTALPPPVPLGAGEQ